MLKSILDESMIISNEIATKLQKYLEQKDLDKIPKVKNKRHYHNFANIYGTVILEKHPDI
jgi:hypothetical protein